MTRHLGVSFLEGCGKLVGEGKDFSRPSRGLLRHQYFQKRPLFIRWLLLLSGRGGGGALVDGGAFETRDLW